MIYRCDICAKQYTGNKPVPPYWEIKGSATRCDICRETDSFTNYKTRMVDGVQIDTHQTDYMHLPNFDARGRGQQRETPDCCEGCQRYMRDGMPAIRERSYFRSNKPRWRRNGRPAVTFTDKWWHFDCYRQPRSK